MRLSGTPKPPGDVPPGDVPNEPVAELRSRALAVLGAWGECAELVTISGLTLSAEVVASTGAHASSTSGTLPAPSTCLPVTGFLPPFASVAAIVARSFAFTPTEHCSV